MPNLAKFIEDPDAMLVMALEECDPTSGTAVKAAIMTRDVVGRAPPVTSVRSAEEGLLVSLDRKGEVDLAYIASLYGADEARVVEELGDLIYQDPVTRSWQTADDYLSGNVREKLAQAETAGAEYARNAEALRAVQPEDVLPGEIDANLGAPWIPEGDIRAFAAELFGVPLSSISVGHLKKDALWSVEAGYDAASGVPATTDYGTARANGTSLLEQALNLKTPVIYDTVSHGGREERVVNQDETLAAREKQKRIKEAFRSWVFSDPERTERLVRVYNDTYNNLRLRVFDGSHLAFPGMNRTITLHPHQEDAIWRGMSGGNTLLAHVVGAGKTFTMAAIGMKRKPGGALAEAALRRPEPHAGAVRPRVPAALPEREAPGRDQGGPGPRPEEGAHGEDGELRVGRHHHHAQLSFERIGMSREYQAKFLREQIAEYDELLVDSVKNSIACPPQHHQDHREAEGPTRGAAEGAPRRGQEGRRARLRRAGRRLPVHRRGPLLQEPRDADQDGAGGRHPDRRERAGVRPLHEGPLPGRAPRGARGHVRHRDAHLEHDGRDVHDAAVPRPEGAFGTAASSTSTAGRRRFGEVVDTMEIAPDGSSLRPRSRFAKFVNLPELQQMFRAFADVQTAAMLDLPRPHLAGDKPTVVPCPMSEEQRSIQERLVARYERIRSQKVDPREDNALAITTDGRKLALDARLIAGEVPECCRVEDRTPSSSGSRTSGDGRRRCGGRSSSSATSG